MGKLAIRTEGGTRLKVFQPATLQQLREEREVDPTEVVYEVTDAGPRDLRPTDVVEPNGTFGVVTADDKG